MSQNTQYAKGAPNKYPQARPAQAQQVVAAPSNAGGVRRDGAPFAGPKPTYVTIANLFTNDNGSMSGKVSDKEDAVAALANLAPGAKLVLYKNTSKNTGKEYFALRVVTETK